MRRREFNRNALFALELHRVKELRFHLTFFNRTSQLEHAISKRRLAVVDVRNDTKISDFIYIHNNILPQCQ
jgi:hypothetical protein